MVKFRRAPQGVLWFRLDSQITSKYFPGNHFKYPEAYFLVSMLVNLSSSFSKKAAAKKRPSNFNILFN